MIRGGVYGRVMRVWGVMYKVMVVWMMVVMLRRQGEMMEKLNEMEGRMYGETKGIKDNMDFMYTYFTLQRFI